MIADPLDDPAIWCAIPVYNNASTIFDVARRAREQIKRVVVIDDGSTDADLRNLLAPIDVVVIRHVANAGKGAALLTAFRHARDAGGHYLITLDGDGQHFPEDIPRFIPELRPDQIVIGYRHEITGTMPQSSLFGRRFSDFWIYIETGQSVSDTQSGFRAYPLAAVLQLKLESRYYNFEMEIITRAIWAGLRTKRVLIRVWYPTAKDRVSSFRPIQDNLRISLLHTRLIIRQMLPLPHKKLTKQVSTELRRTSLIGESSPLGLSIAAGLSLLMGIVLWPWGFIPVAYVMIRLHLNKLIAIACLLIVMPPIVPVLCARLGHGIVHSTMHPHAEWIVGAHAVALPVATLSGWLVFKLAQRTVPSPGTQGEG